MTKIKPNIIIMNRRDAKKYSFVQHSLASVVISITDVASLDNQIDCTSNNRIKSVLPLKFDDVDKGEPYCITEQDASKIAAFITFWSDKVNTIIVHCEAGISRSAGVAAAIMKHLYGSDDLIFNSPQYCPNMTCYRAVLSAFDKQDTENNNV